MTRAVFAPGIDRDPASGPAQGGFTPGRGAGGVFANVLQGATPKFAINNGTRTDLFRNTMARLFVRIDASEMDLFLASVGDVHTRDQLTRRLVGDPTPPRPPEPASVSRASAPASTTSSTAARNTPNNNARRRSSAQTSGYLDFFLTNVQMSLQEKMQVSETLSDNYVAYAFGQAPPVWTFTGSLINSVQDDQASNMFRLYTHILRATQMARRQKSLSISFDSYVVNGVMTNMSLGLTAGAELLVPFSFQLLVKRVFIVNYTSGWVPTTAGTPFPADPLARDYDGTPQEDGVLHGAILRIPPGTPEITPTPATEGPNMSVPTAEQLAQASRARLDAVFAEEPPPPDPLVVAQQQVAERTETLNRLEAERDRLVRANALSFWGASNEDTFNADRARDRARNAASLLESSQNQVRNIEAQRTAQATQTAQAEATAAAEARARAAHPPPTT